jgi:methionine synthase II (cobalamin-independent)
VPGRWSGVGSWPGTDVVEATRTVFGELPAPAVPFQPELPGRGPGADLIGRGAALLVDLPVDLQPSGWRLVDHPGRDLSRAQGWLRQDLDVLAEAGDGYVGPLKIQTAGPWTLAGTVHLPRLERAVVDVGACRDIVASLAEGVRRQVVEVRRLVPGAQVVVQLDEPLLYLVLMGGVRTASGFGKLRAVEEPVLVEGLRAVLDAAVGAGAAATVVHCCAADAPVELMARAGAGALSVDAALLGQKGWEAVAVAVEDGVGLWAGVTPTSGELPSPAAAADAVWTRWRKLGLDVGLLEGVVLTPTCGLAGSTPGGARATLQRTREAAAELAERAASAS